MNIDVYALSDVTILALMGKKIQTHRLKQNITQESLAKEANVSLSAIKRMEKGEIHSMESLIRVLRTLNDLDYLQQFVEEDAISPNEYFKMTTVPSKPTRKRASKKILSNSNNESEW